MKKLIYLLYAASPLMIRARRHPVGYATLNEYIPGSTIGGALSARGLLKLSDVESGGASVSHAYPVMVGEDVVEPSMPAPAVCFYVKRGLSGAAARRDIGESLEDSIVCIPDALVAPKPWTRVQEAIEELSEAISAPLYTLVKLVVGPPVAGCRPRDVGGLKLLSCRRVRVEGFWRDSVAMSVGLRRGEEAMLYSYEAVFHEAWWGVASLPEEAAEELSSGVSVVIGGGRGRGFGRAVIVAEEVECREPSEESRWMLVWSHLPLIDRVSGYAPGDALEYIGSWGREGPRPAILSLIHI